MRSMGTGETAKERSLRNRAAVYQSWANTEDRTARTAPGHRAFEQRFVNQVDPERKLPEVERAKRVEAARKAYFSTLAYRSAASRRRAAVR